MMPVRLYCIYLSLREKNKTKKKFWPFFSLLNWHQTALTVSTGKYYFNSDTDLSEVHLYRCILKTEGSIAS